VGQKRGKFQDTLAAAILVTLVRQNRSSFVHEEEIAMKVSPIVALMLFALAPAVDAKPRIMVHLSRCGGPELKKDQVQVIDLSALRYPQQELQRTLDENRLIAIRERTISDLGSSKRSLAKVANVAGKERCDAVIVMNRGTSPEGKPLANVGQGSRAQNTSTSVTLYPNLIEVVFAERKPEPPATGGQ
jgi:hypothetical protein